MIEGDDRIIVDRIHDLPTPADSMTLWQHADALNQMVQAHRSGRLHHAWLISGQKGIGKATFAFHFARHLMSNPEPSTAATVCRPDDWSVEVVRQVAQSAHPELLHLTRPWDEKTKKFKTQLSVDEIRRTQNFYSMTAGAGGWRITIVDAADEMNANAANALLKILEEPPKRSVFLVITHAAGGLLPTIRSRCRKLELGKVTPDNIVGALSTILTDVPKPTIEEAARLADGSVRRAIQLAMTDVLKHFSAFEKIMGSGGNSTAQNWQGAHAIAGALSVRGAEELYELFLDLALGWIGNQVGNSAPNVAPAELAGWAEVWEKANQSINQADTFNLDRKQVILTLFQLLFDRPKS